MLLLSVMMLKVCAGFIRHNSSSGDSFSMEKGTEESKESKEEPFEKSEKKLLACDFFVFNHSDFSWVSATPLSIFLYKMRSLNHPPKTVPTPPPDFLV